MPRSVGLKIAQAVQGFGAGLGGRGGMFTAGLEAQRRALDEERQQALIQDSFTVQQQLQNKDMSGARQTLVDRIEHIKRLRGDPADTIGLLQAFDAGDFKHVANSVGTIVSYAQSSGRLKQPQRTNQFSLKTSTPQVDPKTGQVFQTSFDPNTGKLTRVDVAGAVQETPGQRTSREVGQVGREAEQRTRETRISGIKADFGERNRAASRTQAPLREALILAQRADQGLTGAAKLKLARLFPSIDVADSAALDSQLQRLALDELQAFKGPTTDFEFGVTQDVVGNIGDSKSANVARLKSLDRAKWFGRREAQQFNNWSKSGKDPDQFTFDFQEQVNTKKGSFSLMDLQDTAVENGMTINEVLRQLNQ